MPPPRITSSGSTTAATAAMARAILPASILTTLSAVRSPLRASANTFFAVRGDRMPSRRAVSTTPAALPAASSGPRRRLDGSRTSVPASGQVPDLAGAAAAAPIQLAVQHQAHADSGPEVQVDEVGDPLAQAVPLLTERGQVHVVLERDLGPELCLHGFDQPLPSPAGQAVGQSHLSTLGLEHTRAAHRREGHLFPADPGVGRQAVCDRSDLSDRGSWHS